MDMNMRVGIDMAYSTPLGVTSFSCHTSSPNWFFERRVSMFDFICSACQSDTHVDVRRKWGWGGGCTKV